MFENVSEVILKVTRDCNLNCRYCYLGDKSRYRGEQMSFEVYKKFIDRVYLDKYFQNKRKCRSDKLQIVFHGGEPTLLGIAKLNKFIKYARLKLPGVVFAMQTNMLLIDLAWIKFFKKNKISPGISIDGSLQKENALRLQKYDFSKKLAMLKKNKIKFGTLMVLNRENIINFQVNLKKFIKKFNISVLKANFVESMAEPKFCYPEITGEQMYENVFLPVMKIFFNEFKIREANIELLLAKFVDSLIFKETSAKTPALTICHAKFCGGGNTIVEVEPDGQVLFCGRWDGVKPENMLGDVYNSADIFGISSYSKVLKLQQQKIKALEFAGCNNCSANAICSYGCLAFAQVKYRGRVKIRAELICSYYKKVYKYLKENYHNIIYIYSQIKRKEIIEVPGWFYIYIAPLAINSKQKNKLLAGLAWKQYQNKYYLAVNKRYLKGLL